MPLERPGCHIRQDLQEALKRAMLLGKTFSLLLKLASEVPFWPIMLTEPTVLRLYMTRPEVVPSTEAMRAWHDSPEEKVEQPRDVG